VDALPLVTATPEIDGVPPSAVATARAWEVQLSDVASLPRIRAAATSAAFDHHHRESSANFGLDERGGYRS
jgi:hypothetical protein